jgi:hypothetical protein
MYIEKVQPETLLEQSMLVESPLKTAFNVAAAHGWDPRSFYKQVDGIGATLIIPTFKEETAGQGKRVGGYVEVLALVSHHTFSNEISSVVTTGREIVALDYSI